jgi:hypothetical protein
MEAIHSEPAWRDRADFIIAAPVGPSATGVTTEQLWARKITGNQFELCCIPFFVYDLALGDIVETTGDLLVDRVAEPSGRFVFRVFFPHSDSPREATLAALSALDALTEWSSPSLLAVDASKETRAKTIAGFLQQSEDQGHLLYETGQVCLASVSTAHWTPEQVRWHPLQR